MLPETQHMETATLYRAGHAWVFTFLDTYFGRMVLTVWLDFLEHSPDHDWNKGDTHVLLTGAFHKPPLDEMITR